MTPTFVISENQFDKGDPDMPDRQLVLEALGDVYSDVHEEDTWISKGNYQLSFWIDGDRPGVVFSNVYVLANPDNFSDSTTLDFCFYFEIEVQK